MLKDPMSTERRDKPARRGEKRGKADGPSAYMPWPTPPSGGPDYRAVALRMLSDFLIAGSKPLEGRTPMPAPPRMPAGGAGFPQPGRTAPPAVASSPPPQVPFPAPTGAAGGPAGSTAMEAIGRFLETARAGGLAAHRRRRG